VVSERTARKPISKKVRFEVFKRDCFTCQYCGRKAPEAILQVDHIKPVKQGGKSDVLNYVTSCAECNAGKSANHLGDSTVVSRQISQLGLLQERREQLSLLLRWRRGLEGIEQQTLKRLAAEWDSLTPQYNLNATGLQTLAQLIRKFGIAEVLEAMHIAVNHYLRPEAGTLSSEVVENAWRKVGGICSTRKREKEDPDLKGLFYCRGILRKRLTYVNEWMAMDILREARRNGVSIEALTEFCKQVKSWTRFRTEIYDLELGTDDHAEKNS